ncbi:MAG: TIGR03084 family metal-binding protein [Alphaproteobacteria bacterium]
MSFTQPIDFREESDALYALLKDVDEDRFDQTTQFKDWTINDVLGHLHFWNYMADLSMQDEDRFVSVLGEVMAETKVSGTLRSFEVKWRDGLSGKALLDTWHEFYQGMAERFAAADPKLRLKWAGPDMSARSSITARLMETWAHGQEVYDALGVVRADADRIKNIAVLGVNTFKFNHMINKIDVPETAPYVRLTAPSGAVWEFGEPSDDERIEGSATEFCQTVTQTRNIADTSLQVTGSVATRWMAMAQCFAGAATPPPPPGTRKTQ